MTAHLLQSTVFAGVAALLTIAFRKQRAGIRYWIWLAASLKFLIPFAVLIELGTHIPWPATMPTARPHFGISVPEDSRPFVEQRFLLAEAPRRYRNTGFAELILVAVWVSGAAAVFVFWMREWHRMRQIIRSGVPLSLDVPIRALSVPARVEPGVVGILRPALLLPDGIVGRLQPDQLQAIILHERCHIRRGDNLAAFLHMIVESVFWFHPLVWWIERRLVEERERACDEDVVRLTSDPESYAQSILNVCRFYSASASICVSGVTGAELRKRIEDIMKARVFQPLNATRRLVLAVAGALAIGLPVVIGFAIAPQTRAQSQSTAPVAFEVVSIKLSKNPDPRSIRLQLQPGGRFSTTAIPLRLLISEAYGIPFQSPRISTTPEFDAAMPTMAPAQFDIEAVAPQGAIPAEATDSVQTQIIHRMLQSLLADRFKLVVRRETNDLPVYAIVIGKNGAKLKKSDLEEKDCAGRVGKPDIIPCHEFNGGRGRGIHTDAANITDLAQFVENWAGRPVVDKTGLMGLFNIQTTGWRPQETIPIQPRPDGQPPSAEQQAFADPSTPTLFDIFEQLGLKLEAQRAPVEMLTLVSVERPTEN
jgi:bla regulator protein BlaR1